MGGRVLIIIFLFLSGVLEAAGEIDPLFGTEGIVITDFGGSDIAHNIAVQKDGKSIVVGDSSGDFAIARYEANGTLDMGFGDEHNGKVITDISGGMDYGRDVVIQDDNKIIVVGFSHNKSYDFTVMKYKSDGTLDPDFGDSGVAVTDFGSSESDDDFAMATAIQNDGKIVVAGYAFLNFAIVRYDSNGSLDKSFGSNGKVVTDVNGGDYGSDVAIQDDGKIVLCGDSGDDFALLRYESNGTLDTEFGEGDSGIVLTDLGGQDRARRMVIQEDGKIILVGFSNINSETRTDIAMVRYNPDGSIDHSFGENGIVRTDIQQLDDMAFAIALQKDGKIVVAGSSLENRHYAFTVARYTPNGKLDTNFGKNGIDITPVGGIDDDVAYGVSIDAEGKIIVAGSADSERDFGVVRYIGKDPNITLSPVYYLLQ